MGASDSVPPHLAHLAAITRDMAIATADGSTLAQHQRLSEFLAQVRDALGMDIAFVSQFVGDQRVFRVVSVASDDRSMVTPGNSDPLVDSYCKRVIEGRLPRAIPNADELPEAKSLPITQRLRIGAYLSVPVVLQSGQIFGTLCCFSHAPRPELSRHDADALQDVANVIAASIERDGSFRKHIWMG